MQRIVDIASSGTRLSLYRGFLIVKKKDTEIGRIAITDVHALIVHAYGASITTNLMAKLAESGTPVVLCDMAQKPVSITLPLAGHFSQNSKMREQWESTLPLRKQLWKKVVVAKIKMQASLLKARSESNIANRLNLMATQVKSGDPSNLEAQAAKLYWPALMGKKFRRVREKPGINTFLNYGYTILRSMVARAIVASGLHPSIGIAHSHRENSMALADDLVEPFRPIVDAAILGMLPETGEDMELNQPRKRLLTSLIAFDVSYQNKTSPLHITALYTAQSLSKSFKEKSSKELRFFEPLPPLQWSSLWEYQLS